MLLEGQKLVHMKNEFLLGSKLIGDDQKPYFIAEAQNNWRNSGHLRERLFGI